MTGFLRQLWVAASAPKRFFSWLEPQPNRTVRGGAVAYGSMVALSLACALALGRLTRSDAPLLFVILALLAASGFFLYAWGFGSIFVQRAGALELRFCVTALTEALERYGAPEIFNSDQGAQFTSQAFTSVLLKHGVRISMEGKGRWIDNVFSERFCRSLKYEQVYLYAYRDLNEARAGLDRYRRYYNSERRHSRLGKQTP